LFAALFGSALLLLLNCGGGSLPVNNPPRQELPAGAPPVPTASDPYFGTAGNVLISDRNYSVDATVDFLWVGFNSSSKWQDFLTLNKKWPHGLYIGGHVVLDSKNPLGVYFDPDTALAAEAIAEGAQTSLDAIKQNPSYFAESGFLVWYVPATIESIRDSTAP
jgi:hypothetical protein